ncbi:uncharacterized protein N0V89_010846 [Didymosphaeria variabile]|uniref:Uncharacterized protein n=1 Tax=Didymosphaeria variabile TaxID=1932322 RepID=A0A9W9C6Y8_9PLEO|nr:uncharacterized protein N0V89_010846 [Didymosphaeria variabile]KAJ4346913.1 hypothetical protein N0V89_010846 [Didymosphaeria variabile]
MKLAAKAQFGADVIESPTSAQVVDIYVDNGSTLPPGVAFSALSSATGPSSAVLTANAVIPPGTDDVVLAAATQIVSSVVPSAAGIGALAAVVSSAIRGLPVASALGLPVIPPVGPGLAATSAIALGLGGFGSLSVPEVQSQDVSDALTPVSLDDPTVGVEAAPAPAPVVAPAPAPVVAPAPAEASVNDTPVSDAAAPVVEPNPATPPAADAALLANNGETVTPNLPAPLPNANDLPVSGFAVGDPAAVDTTLPINNAVDVPAAQPPLPNEGVVPALPAPGDGTPIPAAAPADGSVQALDTVDPGLPPPAGGDPGAVGATAVQPLADVSPYDPFTGANDGPFIPQKPPIGPSGYDGDDDTQYDAEDQGKGPHGRRPGQDPKDPSPGGDVEDTTQYDGEDYGNGPNGQSKSHGKKPTKGNGPDQSGDDSDEECPEWCLEDDGTSSPERSSHDHSSNTTSAMHAKETGGKTKHKKKKAKKTSKTPHRIAVTVDDNVVYTSDYKREVADAAPSSGGFSGFKWPSKKTDDTSESSNDIKGSQGQGQDKPSEGQGQDKDSSSDGSSQNDKEISDQLQKASKGQRGGGNAADNAADNAPDNAADSGDGVSGSTLPDWLNDLQKPKESGSPDSAKNITAVSSGAKDSSGTSSGSENDSAKGKKKKKKKSKGKCPKSCKNKKGSKPSGASSGKPSETGLGGQPTGAPTESATGTPDFAAPTTFVTLASEKEDEALATKAKGGDSPGATGEAGKGGLPAGKEDSGDTFTGSTLAGVCPKQCNPFNPAENLCDHESSGCTTAGGSKYYCACRAGYKLNDSSNKDFSKQFKVSGQPYVYVYPGAKCDKLCDDGLCDEVLMRDQCV